MLSGRTCALHLTASGQGKPEHGCKYNPQRDVISETFFMDVQIPRHVHAHAVQVRVARLGLNPPTVDQTPGSLQQRCRTEKGLGCFKLLYSLDLRVPHIFRNFPLASSCRSPQASEGVMSGITPTWKKKKGKKILKNNLRDRQDKLAPPSQRRVPPDFAL